MTEPTSIGPSLRDQCAATQHRQTLRGDEPGQPPYVVPLMSRRDRTVFGWLVALWLIALVTFWAWWLQPEHNIGAFRFAINTLLLVWTTAVPGYFLLIFSRSQVVGQSSRLPRDWRVAMVVTKAPSEPTNLVQETLLAMLSQRYPHDTWLADEDPTPAMLAWCAEHGVQVSTRRGVAEYHNPVWPRRTKTKEGNLAYFYDHHGYAEYDFVAQLDADHVPEPGYLEEMLRPFLDPAVGYVSAPSICDSNASNSWSARGRLYVEAALHGALQAGYNGGLAPLCIGSHYAVRTAALADVGGLGPELAEDHSTTLIMNAAGWRGVHALDALAHGEGPNTFHDAVTQEFQWSRSLMTILLNYTPIYIRSLPWRLKLQFLFAQTWYPLFSLSMLAMMLLPIVALTTSSAYASIVYVEFFFRMTLVTLAVLLIMRWIRSKGWFRPDAKVISWEGILFLFARWPWSLLGGLVAVGDRLMGRQSGFKVTPKTSNGPAPLPFSMVAVYLVISIACGLPALLVEGAGSAAGFYVFSIINCMLYLGIAVAVAILHCCEQGRWVRLAYGSIVPGLPLLAAAVAVLVGGVSLRLPAGVEGLLWGTNLVHAKSSTSIASLPSDDQLKFGIYDPARSSSDSDFVAIEHVFVSWLDDNSGRLDELATYVRARNRWPMVTIEPWSDGRQGATSLLRAVVAGDYDDEIRRSCSEVAGMDMPLFVRWGHEMEAPTGRYPWADHNADAYVAAYRKFVDACRSEDEEFYFVWSPRGDIGGVDRYYPGDDVVDYVGLSVYSYAAWEDDYYGRLRSFAENLGERYERVRGYGKNVMIAELGVEGSLARQAEWLADGFLALDHFPLLRMVVYFNALDHPEAWGPDWPVPDWRIDPRIFTRASE